MSSDAMPTIATVRSYLADHVRPMLPEAWTVIDHIAAADERDIPQLVFEFTEVSNTEDGQVLAVGDTVCGFDLCIVIPTGDGGPKAETEVDEALDALVSALDDSPVYWGPTARKQRTDTGQYLWRVPLRIPTRRPIETP